MITIIVIIERECLMFASFLITFREGLEAFLIVGIILSYLAKLNSQQFNRYIYTGVIVGIVVSFMIAYIFQVVIYGIDNEIYQHYLMIFILLFATIVLSYMVFWMARQSNQVKEKMQKNIAKLIDAKNIAGMVFLAFLAVLREGVETVLFFSSLTMSQQSSIEDGMIGAFLGLFLSIAIVYILIRGVKNIPIKLFFKYTSLLILIIAAGLFSSAISMMQAADILPIYVESVYDISYILDDRSLVGTFLRALFGYNSSPTLLHFSSWLSYIVISFVFWKRLYAKN